MKSNRSLAFVIAAIFALLALGAFFSPSYTQQIGYAQWFLFAGGILFIASVVVIVAAFGFHTFALYLAVLIAIAIATFGLYGGILVVLLTYLTWGFVFALQVLLVYNHVPAALDWFQARYTYRAFYTEYRIFYPMLWIFYFLLEVIPGLIYRDSMRLFDPKKTLDTMKKILP
jgi:hypothetical protein